MRVLFDAQRQKNEKQIEEEEEKKKREHGLI